jgi:hypothetical protein
VGSEDILKVINEGVPYSPVDHEEPPRPLMRDLPPGQEFPVEALGELAKAARAIQDMTQAPAGLCGQSVLAAVSLVVQAHVNVQLPTGQVKPISEFFVTIGGSGERKTACDELALKPIVEYEGELRENYDRAYASWLNADAVWSKRRDIILKSSKDLPDSERLAQLDALGPAPQRPMTPMMICPEPTFEGLTKLLQVGLPTIGIFTDEGGQFLGGHGMNKDNKLGMATNLSGCWDGKAIKRVRAGDGVTILHGRRIAFHLMLQPKVSTILLSDEQFADQGLLSRMLVCAPVSTVGKRFWRDPKSESYSWLGRYSIRMEHFLGTPLPLAEGKPNELQPRKLPLSDAAKALWIEYVNTVEMAMGPMGAYEPIKGLANKLPEHAARLAAIIAAYEDLGVLELSSAHIQAGISLAEFYAGEALRLFSVGHFDQDLQTAQTLLDWLQASWHENRISLPDIYQGGPNAIRDLHSAMKVVRILEDHGWLKPIEGNVRINGKVRKQAWEIVPSPL